MSKIAKAGFATAGLVAGVVLAGTLGAQAATNAASPSPSSSSSSVDPHPGDNGADGIPEAQEHPGGFHGLDKTGKVTAVGANSVTIGSTTYAVTAASDIDKNGEAKLSDLVVGDTVRFNLDSTGKTIDKLHAGDEAKDRPAGPPRGGMPPPPSGSGTAPSSTAGA